MKLLLIILLSVMTANLSAQSWRYRNNGFSKSDIERARIIEENNRRVTRQSSQRYVQQRGYNRQIPNQSRFGIQNKRLDYNDEHDKLMDSKESPKTNNTVSLVTNGTGYTIEEATRNALRSAIEQAFGTFVSANTEVLNDELIKDEIATVTSGNVSQYNVLSTTKNENGLYDVSLQAVVSIGNLTNYTKSKGFQVELAGAEFVMNMKMRELNKKNELAAIEHLQKKLKSIANNGGLFNYQLEKSEPILVGDSKYGVKLKLLFYGNDNTKAFYDEIYNTISALSLSQSEVNEYKKVGLKYYAYNKQFRKTEKLLFDDRDLFYLRNDYENLYSNGYEEVSWLMPNVIEQVLQFEIYDNLENHFYCNTDNDNSKNMVWFYSNAYGGIGTIKNFHLVPANRIAGIKGKEMNIGEYKLYTPLVDYMKKDINYLRLLHFNPLLDYCEDDYRIDLRGIPGWNKEIIETILERNRRKCYYQLEFFILYSEDELYQLKNISVKYYNRNLVNSVSTEKVQEEKSQKQTMNLANDNNALHSNIEHRAEFPGGTGALSQYISNCLRYPVVAEENGIQGNVVIQFYVEIDGSITDPTVSKSVDPSLDKEALRMVRSMPKWNPAQKNGEAVRSQQTITIPFRL